MVDVVYYHFVGRVYDHSVHEDILLVDPGYGVKNSGVSGCTPFVSDEGGVVGWVYEGYFVLGEGYVADAVVDAEAVAG